MTPAALLAAPALWATYTWGSHALTLGCRWRGERAGRNIALTMTSTTRTACREREHASGRRFPP